LSTTRSSRRMDLVVDPRTKEVCAVETIAACERRVLQVTIDNDVHTCAGIRTEGHEMDEETQDPYIDLEHEAFEALRHCIAVGVPALFAEWQQPLNPRRPSGASTALSFFDFPVFERNTALEECKFDAPLLKWAEQLEHQRADAGKIYASALEAYASKGKDRTEWLAHCAMNEWPSANGLSSRPMPFVDYERIKHPERARVPWSETDKLGASVHLERRPEPRAPAAAGGGPPAAAAAAAEAAETPPVSAPPPGSASGSTPRAPPPQAHRVIVRGDPVSILKRCTSILLRGQVMELSEILCDYVLVAVVG
jgi:hypothetical protein